MTLDTKLKLYHYKTERDAEILSALKSGLTYADVGRKFSITTQRVCQIAQQAEFQYDIDMEKYMTVAEAAILFGYTDGGILNAIQKGKLKAIRAGRKWFIPRTDYLSRLCAECGQNPVPLDKKIKYCSRECYDKAAYKSHCRSQWRKHHRKFSQKITKSIEIRRKGIDI